MKLKIASIVAVLVTVSGCQKQPDITSVAAVAPMLAAATSKPNATAEDWRAALTSTYVESSKKSEGDGVTTFMACFNDPSTPAKCMFGKRDAFRKTTHFTPVGSTFQRYEFENHVFSYIALVECGMPIYFFVPRYSSEGGWLFIKKVAMLLDGDLALERDFSELRPDIKREILPSGRVEEEVHLVATEADQMGMHKAIEAKEISVRITGEKGYVNLKAKQISSLRDDATIMQFVYDKLGRALKEKTPATCK